MKKIILGSLIFLSACNSGSKDTVSFKDIEPLQGNWVGVQSILFNDDSTVSNYPTQLAVGLLKDSLELNITNIYDDGHQETEKGILSINKDGSKLSFGASEYDIREVSKIKDGLTIVAYKEDEDNDKPAGIRLTITMQTKELTMLL